MPYADLEKRRNHHREYMKKWYAKNKQKHIEYVTDCKKKKREWFEEIRNSLRCTECGETHIATLDFHHEYPEAKETEVVMAVHLNWSKKRILAEIAKCIVLCSNCHRKLHWEKRIARNNSRERI